MQKEAFSFFENNIDTSLPVLLGLSGGPDSTALLHLLVKWGRVKIHLVHVDHGWREESGRECELLRELAKELGLPFHTKRLEGKCSEDECRQERTHFFKEVCAKVQASGIILGHHADDLSETVFKRVLEGAALSSLAGLHKVRSIDGLVIYRPLLTVSKSEVIEWLSAHGINYFIDPTNSTGKNLRAKCRMEIFPYLKTHFGKEFEKSLAKVGMEAEELYYYLMERCKPYFEGQIVGPWGIYLENLPKSKVELKFLLRQLSNKVLSRSELDTAVALLEQKAANKRVANISIDRGRAFLALQDIVDVEGSLPIKEGRYTFGNWLVHITKTFAAGPVKNHFRDGWRGEICTIIPEGNYVLTKGLKTMRRQNKEYGDFLSQHKIPHFLASKIPVIACENEIIEDFLSETKPPCNERNFMIHCIMMMAKNRD